MGAVTGFMAGIGLTIYGGFNFLTAGQNATNPDEVDRQKNWGLGIATAGIAALFVSVAFSTEVIACPIDALQEILQKAGPNSLTARTFKVLNMTHGISCDNWLPWQTQFSTYTEGYISSIKPGDLKKPAMWGFDERGRAYIAIKYIYNRFEKGALSLYQFSPNSFYQSGPLTTCGTGRLDPRRGLGDQFTENLRSFLRGEEFTCGPSPITQGNSGTEGKRSKWFLSR
jgi:hypothetical protein